MPTLLQSAKEYGARVVRPNAVLPQFALRVAQAVASGQASSKDADKVYLAYLDSVTMRSKAQSPGSHKVQVSKLRQIMLLAEQRPAHAEKLLAQVEKMHGELMREVPAKSLFAAMVDVARVQRRTRRQLNVSELRKLIAN
jgi:hypothetical protein